MLAILKKVGAKAMGREESLSANEDEEERNKLKYLLAILKKVGAKAMGREESLSAN
uniref:Lycosin 4m n=2 Tax=Alopecosa marikovskyi TaxID=2066572 RepID=A0A8D7ZTR1_ALOMR|nr:Lycosin 4m precursor [Alopecosa marikovskyi]